MSTAPSQALPLMPSPNSRSNCNWSFVARARSLSSLPPAPALTEPRSARSAARPPRRIVSSCSNSGTVPCRIADARDVNPPSGETWIRRMGTAPRRVATTACPHSWIAIRRSSSGLEAGKTESNIRGVNGCAMRRALDLAARMVASIIAGVAPEYARASIVRSASWASGIARVSICRIWASVGRPRLQCRSNRPGLKIAGSRASGWLLAPTRMTPSAR